MGWNRKRDTIRHYDGLASVYDFLYGYEQLLKIKLALDSVSLSDSNIVLDAGCGTGLLLPHIGERAELVVGLDISRELLKIALNRSKQGSNRFYSLVCADADHMPFPNEVFDKVFAITLLQDVPDPDLTLDEINRVAKMNATIVATGLKKSFTRERFAGLLNGASLEFFFIDTEEQVRCHIAICRKKLNEG